MIHSAEEYEKAVEASQILFGGATSEALHKLDEQTLLQVFEGVPQFTISKEQLGCTFVDLCADLTKVFPSKGECRKMVQGGGVSLNKEKVADPMLTVTEDMLIAGMYLIACDKHLLCYGEHRVSNLLLVERHATALHHLAALAL